MTWMDFYEWIMLIVCNEIMAAKSMAVVSAENWQFFLQWSISSIFIIIGIAWRPHENTREHTEILFTLSCNCKSLLSYTISFLTLYLSKLFMNFSKIHKQFRYKVYKI